MTRFRIALLPCALMAALAAFSAGAQVAIDPPAEALQDAPHDTVVQVSPLAPSSSSWTSTRSGWVEQIYAQAQSLQAGQNVADLGPAPTRALKLGDSGPDARWLRQALQVHGYLQASTTPEELLGPVQTQPSTWINPNVYTRTEEVDADVVEAVIALQAKNGLKQDGVAGKDVYQALTQNQAALGNALQSWAQNIERWAQDARAEGHRKMIVVNIPSFTLHAINLDTMEEEMQSRVIVGGPHTQTPLMTTRVVNLKANPDWSPPPSIRGARYQRPGPNNALGLMRFSTDNNQNIYLHDTNARGLFANDYRALSHGCVRVHQWKGLAAWVAGEDEGWVDEVALAGGKTRFLKIDAVPVVLAYSRVDLVDGKPRQFADVYGKGSVAIGDAELSGNAGAVAWRQE